MLRTIIINNNKHYAEALAEALKNFPEVSLLETFDSTKKALTSMKALRPYLIFINTNMPLIDGYEFIQIIDNENSHVILTTDSVEDIQKGLMSDAIDCMLQPPNTDLLRKTIHQLYNKLKFEKYKSQSAPQGHLQHNNKIAFQLEDEILMIEPNEIIYIEFNPGNCKLNLKSQSGIKNLKNCHEVHNFMLSIPNFIRVSENILIHLNEVKSFTRKNGIHITMSNNHKLPIYPEYEAEIVKLFN